MLDELSYLKFEVQLEAREKAIIPSYHGSMFRGVIGHTLRQVSCVNKNNKCVSCNFNTSCPYTEIFFSLDKNENHMLTKVDTVPNPFIIYPVMKDRRELNTGEVLKFNITLIGKAIKYLHYFILSIIRIEYLGIGAKRYSFKVLTIKDIDEGMTIVQNGNCNLRGINEKNFSYTEKDVSRITLKIDTPLRIKDKGEFTGNINFHLFMRNLLRRIAMVYEFHLDNKLDINHKSLLEQAEQIKTEKVNLVWQKMFRYSSSARRKLSIGGFTGLISFKGNLKPFMPYVYAGELLHIGKGCTLGLGHYKIIEERR